MYRIRPISVKSFLRYVKARLSEKQRELAYRFYLTTVLNLIAKNTGSHLQNEYMDIYYGRVDKEEKTQEQIIQHFNRKGIKAKNEVV